MQKEYSFCVTVLISKSENFTALDDLLLLIEQEKDNFETHQQLQINEYIRQVFSQQQIKLKFDRKVNWNHYRSRALSGIYFDHLTLDNIKLQDCENLRVQFYHCTISNIWILSMQLTDQSKQINQNFQISTCTIQIADLTQCNWECLNNYESNINLLVYNMQPKVFLEVKYFGEIKQIKFLSFEYLEQLYLNFDKFPIIISSVGIQRDFLDLSKFSKLKFVNIPRIYSDILLPQKLESLILSQENQFLHKILNDVIHSRLIDITSFNLRNKLLRYKQLNLYQCKVDQVVLNSEQQYLLKNEINELLVLSKLTQIYLATNIIKKILFINRDIEILSLNCIPKISINLIIEQDKVILQQKDVNNLDNISSYESIINNGVINFQCLHILKQINLTFNSACSCIENPILFPISLQSVNLIQCLELKPQDTTLFDFSSLVNIQNLEIKNFRISRLIMQQGKVEFFFNTACEIFIKIQSQTKTQIYQCKFEQFMSNVDFLEINGLQNIIIQNEQVNELSLKEFKNVKKLKLKDVEVQLEFPILIEEININSSQITEYKSNFDLAKYKRLKKVKLANSRIDNLIAQPNVQCHIDNCIIDNLNIKSLQYVNNTEIKTFHQVRQSTITYEKFQYPNWDNRICNNSINTLKVTNPHYIHKLELIGLQHLIFNSNQNSQIIDFRPFYELNQIYLLNISCDGIIFGSRHKSIFLETTNKSKINFLDFSNCKMTCIRSQTQSVVKCYQTEKIHFGDNKVHLQDCFSKFVFICQKFGSNFWLDSYPNKQQCSKYVVVEQIYKQGANNDLNRYYTMIQARTKQRILYKVSEQKVSSPQKLSQPQYFINISYLLEYKMYYLYQKMNDLLNE